jgi:hypothetical protein
MDHGCKCECHDCVHYSNLDGESLGALLLCCSPAILVGMVVIYHMFH